jgi:hypothetical protein
MYPEAKGILGPLPANRWTESDLPELYRLADRADGTHCHYLYPQSKGIVGSFLVNR